MQYKGIEITPVNRPNEPHCNSCGDSGERWKIRVCFGDTGGTSIFLCTDCLRALATMAMCEDNDLAQFYNRRADTVKHGHFIVTDEKSSRCSVCGEPYLYDTWKYCPACGARLDEPVEWE